MAWFEQVGQLVYQHVVDDPRRHRLQPMGEPDRSVHHRARSPAGGHVADPAHARRPGAAVEEALGQLGRPGHQRGVTSAGSGTGVVSLPAGDALHQVGDQPLFVRLAEPGWNQHHYPVAVAICGNGPPAASAAADFDDRAGIGGARGASELSHVATIGAATDEATRCPQVVNGRVGASSRGYPQPAPQVWTCG